MKIKSLFRSLLYVLLFSFTVKSFSNTVLVFVDHTRNLDYYVNGKGYKFKNDIKSLLHQYNENSLQRIVLVEVRKDKENRFKGRLFIKGKGVEVKLRIKSRKLLKEKLKQYMSGNVDFFLLSHTLNKKRLKEFLDYGNTNYDIILASACKMATIEKLNIMKQYSNYVLASPENIHLAHFELDNLSNVLKGSSLEKGKNMLNKSYDRLLKFTKSNLVLNLYDLSKSGLNFCNTKDLSTIILSSKIKLSRFESRKEDDKQFKILGCHN